MSSAGTGRRTCWRIDGQDTFGAPLLNGGTAACTSGMTRFGTRSDAAAVWVSNAGAPGRPWRWGDPALEWHGDATALAAAASDRDAWKADAQDYVAWRHQMLLRFREGGLKRFTTVDAARGLRTLKRHRR